MGAVQEKGRSESVDVQVGRRIIDALVITGRLHVTDDEMTIMKALDKLFYDITEGELHHLQNKREPFPTVEQAVIGLLEAFADDVLGRVN